MEIDLTKLVVGRVWLRNFWYKVEYEGLHRICSSCGCYGHLTRECPSTATTPESPAVNPKPSMLEVMSQQQVQSPTTMSPGSKVDDSINEEHAINKNNNQSDQSVTN